MINLYHYTCDHGYRALGQCGQLKSLNAQLGDSLIRQNLPEHAWSNTKLIWLTDLNTPMRDALGLTSNVLGCDRTAYRYQLSFTDRDKVQPWMHVRQIFSATMVEGLEAAPGAMPMHWWIATQPVHVDLSRIGARS